ncbi:MAG TPA: amidase family protein [Gemmatimonadales bacterium]|nr:amidase family protein [Gemmatimonadales bacterium]
MEDLADRSASELARLVRSREISPVEIVEDCLARVERFNPAVNAVVTLNPRALDEADELERRLVRGDEVGLLAGLPVGIKDVTPVAGLRTTYGSTLYRDHVASEDALVVQRLRAADAIVLGKTNCPEFAAGGATFNDVFGRTRNPWDPTRTAGGSTGGGAAGLATGMIALAEGTDLGGSLRIPASFCGVVGLRPSVGLVPTYPADWLWDTLQVEGPIARTAEDVALMLQAVSGPSAQSPLAQPRDGRNFVAAVARGVSTDLRVAYCCDVARIGIDSEIEKVCGNAVRGLRDLGVTVEEIELDLSFARKPFLALRGLWFVAQMFPRLDKVDQFGPNVAGNIRAGLATTTYDLGAAEAARTRVWYVFRELFQRFDHLLTPCMAVPPFPVEQNYPETVAGKKMETYVDWLAPTFVLSLTGLPVASVPCGLDPDGLPVGLQIVGKPQGEEAVLALASQVQHRHPIGRPTLRV